MRIPDFIPLEKDGQYCMSCFHGPIRRLLKGTQTYYECKSCGKVLPRSLVIDHTIEWSVDSDRTYWHSSIGVIVINDDRRILTYLRRFYPFAVTIPAGHIDAGESSLEAAERELREETGLVAPLRYIAKFDQPGDSCRRGCDDHHWDLYACSVHGHSNIQASDEGEKIEWLTIAELRKKDNKTGPLEYIIKTFGHQLVPPAQ